MSSEVSTSPELVIALAGPVGTPMDTIEESLANALTAVGYETVFIKITKAMETIPTSVVPSGDSFYDRMCYKMDYGNALCRANKDPAFLARLAVFEIRSARRAFTGSETRPRERAAYVVRQLKRPAEVELLRAIYGEQFVLVSAYGPANERFQILSRMLRKSLNTRAKNSDITLKANELMERDEDEDTDQYGQKLRETFHRGDVFIDGIDRSGTDANLTRFVQALFGRCDISPTKAEYGMYAAKSASLRSADLSRQVGAAIFSSSGDIITQSCNEVPRAFGGNYWDSESPDFRDVKIGFDPNETETNEILRDIFQRLSDAGPLKEALKKLGPPDQIVKLLTKKPSDDDDLGGPLLKASVRDLTEYGRVVHAEMGALCDAARTGKSVLGATLFCTTFPCHNCTKHLIAAGITRVVYIEPYPKSKAKMLHKDEIEIENDVPTKVSFVPFVGISPIRYKSIFEKSRRKNPDGSAKRWLKDRPLPMLHVHYSAGYIRLEAMGLETLAGSFSANPSSPSKSPESSA